MGDIRQSFNNVPQTSENVHQGLENADDVVENVAQGLVNARHALENVAQGLEMLLQTLENAHQPLSKDHSKGVFAVSIAGIGFLSARVSPSGEGRWMGTLFAGDHLKLGKQLTDQQRVP